MAGLFSIEKVTLGATSDEAFQLATQMCFSTGLLVSVCKDKFVVKKGEVLNIPSDFMLPGKDDLDASIFQELKVLDCEPVHQGTITVSTQITIIDISQTDEDTAKKCSDASKTIAPLHLSDFASQIASFPPQHASSGLGKSHSTTFEVELLSEIHRTKLSSKCDTSYDFYNSVFVSKQFAKQHQLFQGCLLEMSKHHEKLPVQSFRKKHKPVKN